MIYDCGPRFSIANANRLFASAAATVSAICELSPVFITRVDGPS